MTSETERIRWLSDIVARDSAPASGRGVGASGTWVGVGDDAAVWRPPEHHGVVLTVDVQVEGTHFRRDWLTARELGRRALEVAGSDLAAMAAEPGGILVSLTLPPEEDESYFRELWLGIAEAAGGHDLVILGGNLARGPLTIGITAVGSVPPDRVIRRGGAGVGDAILVGGYPGRAALGRELLLGGRRDSAPVAEAARSAFRSPRARLLEALELVKRAMPTAMIDVSDGVGIDLAHVLGASGNVRAVLDAGRLRQALAGDGPDGAAWRELSRSLGRDLADAVLSGGEDYELLFTMNQEAATRLEQAPPGRHGRITRIGRLEHGKGEILVEEEGRQGPWTPAGFDHFSG